MTGQSDFHEKLEEQYRDPEWILNRRLEILLPFFTGGQKFLDIGCGTGQLLLRIEDRYDELVGVEISHEAVAITRTRFGANPKVRIVEADAMEVNFPEGEFDGCACLDVLEHLHTPQRMVEKAFALLRPGGVFIASTPNWYDFIWSGILGVNKYHVSFHSYLGWRKIITRTGFRVTLCRTVKYPLIDWPWPARNLPLFGMCVVVVAEKP